MTLMLEFTARSRPLSLHLPSRAPRLQKDSVTADPWLRESLVIISGYERDLSMKEFEIEEA
jgi:hypothetical protein